MDYHFMAHGGAADHLIPGSAWGLGGGGSYQCNNHFKHFPPSSDWPAGRPAGHGLTGGRPAYLADRQAGSQFYVIRSVLYVYFFSLPNSKVSSHHPQPSKLISFGTFSSFSLS